jgi:hypothetical protein
MYGQAQGFLGQASDAFRNVNPNAQGYDWQGRTAQSRGAYTDSLGMNGGEGYSRAMQNFRTGPGYNFMVDQATDAVARKASAMGMGASGNTMAAINDRASNLANMEFGNHQNRLAGLDQMDSGIAAGMSQGDANRALSLAQGQAGAFGAQAGLASQYGRDQMQYGRDMAGLSGQFGRDMAGSFAGEAGLDLGVAGQKSNIWQQFANQNLKAGEASVAANNADEAGRVGMGMGIANMAAGALGGMGGIGGMATGLRNLYGQATGAYGRGSSGFY